MACGLNGHSGRLATLINVVRKKNTVTDFVIILHPKQQEIVVEAQVKKKPLVLWILSLVKKVLSFLFKINFNGCGVHFQGRARGMRSQKNLPCLQLLNKFLSVQL